MNISKQIAKEFTETKSSLFTWTPSIKYLTVGDSTDSCQFKTGINGDYTWKLCLLSRLNSMDMYLTLVKSKQCSVSVKCNFSISFSYSQTIESNLDFYEQEEKHIGPIKYLSSSNDNVVISCDIQVKKTFENKMLIEKIEEILPTLFNNYESLLLDKQFSDVTLKVSETNFYVHKIILTARSPVFAAMFNNTMKENITGTVEINDVDPAIMTEILRFIYAGRVQNIEDNAKDLLIAANKYQLHGLKAMCSNNIYQGLTVENVIETLEFAELHNENDLKALALQFIYKHGKNFINTQDFFLTMIATDNVSIDMLRSIVQPEEKK